MWLFRIPQNHTERAHEILVRVQEKQTQALRDNWRWKFQLCRKYQQTLEIASGTWLVMLVLF